jgi:CheY-like chemotaxis protein
MANILVVDDDTAVQQTIKLLLDMSGHDVTAVSDGRKAIGLVQDGEYDLLIVDIFMPGMDGLETMKLVHQHRPSLPIIVISGHAFPTNCTPSPDFLMMATKLGAISSLQKPFKPAALLGCVAKCLAASVTSELTMALPLAAGLRSDRL